MKKAWLILLVSLIAFSYEKASGQIEPSEESSPAAIHFNNGIKLFEEYLGSETTIKKSQELTLKMVGEFSKAFSVDARIDEKTKYEIKEKRIQATFWYMLAVACNRNKMYNKALLFINKAMALETKDKMLYMEIKKELLKKKANEKP